MQQVKYSVKKLLQFFLEHPKTAFKPKDIYKKFNWNPGTIRKEIKIWKDKGVLKQNLDKSYVLLDSKPIGIYLQEQKKRGEKRGVVRGATETSKPTPIQIKSHDIAIENIDLSGYIEYMQKFNMLKSIGNDNAHNVGLRSGVAIKFSMRVCLKNPKKSAVYPILPGWKEELTFIFNNDPQILDRIYNKDTKEKMAIALEWDSVKDLPMFKGKEFKDLKDMIIRGPDGYLQFCESQFEGGEVCVHGDSKKDTENIIYELLEGTLERAHSLKIIEENVARMPFVLVQIMGEQVGEAIQKAMATGIEKGIEDGIDKAMKKYEYKPPYDEKKDV